MAALAMLEKDLKIIQKNPNIYSMDAPDGRWVSIGRKYFTSVDVRRSTISERLGWAWEIVDPSASQAIGRSGFLTKREAFTDAKTWIEKNPAGIFHEGLPPMKIQGEQA